MPSNLIGREQNQNTNTAGNASTGGPQYSVANFILYAFVALVVLSTAVNAVAPGPIWTPLIPSSFDPQHVAEFGKDTLLGRPGQPNEVAPSYVFLASDDASYMTGQVLHPNGGEIVRS